MELAQACKGKTSVVRTHHGIALEDSVLEESRSLRACKQTADHVRSRALSGDGDAVRVAAEASDDLFGEGQGGYDIGEGEVRSADGSRGRRKETQDAKAVLEAKSGICQRWRVSDGDRRGSHLYHDDYDAVRVGKLPAVQAGCGG